MSEKPDIEEEKKPTEGKSFSSSTNLCCSHKITYLGFHSMLFVHTHTYSFTIPMIIAVHLLIYGIFMQNSSPLFAQLFFLFL